MMTANAANLLSVKYNEQFKGILSEIRDAALAKQTDLKINFHNHTWLNEIGFKDFNEVMSGLGYKVYNNENHFRVLW